MDTGTHGRGFACICIFVFCSLFMQPIDNKRCWGWCFGYCLQTLEHLEPVDRDLDTGQEVPAPGSDNTQSYISTLSLICACHQWNELWRRRTHFLSTTSALYSVIFGKIWFSQDGRCQNCQILWLLVTWDTEQKRNKDLMTCEVFCHHMCCQLFISSMGNVNIFIKQDEKH